MTANAAEWIMAAAAVGTGLFVGWQTSVLNSTLNSPFEANLQSTQIEVCAEAIKSTGAYVDDLMADGGWAEWLLNEDSVVGKDSSYDREKATSFVSEYFAAKARVAESFRRSLIELKIYASPDTQRQIDAIMLIPTGLVFTDKFKEISGSKDLSIVSKDLEEAFLPVREKCRSIMLGEKKGLI